MLLRIFGSLHVSFMPAGLIIYAEEMKTRRPRVEREKQMNHRGFAIIAVSFLVSAAAMAETSDRPSPDWITTTNQPCKVWNPEPQADESVTWSGGCKDGLASGKGILRWTENGKPDVEFDGEYKNGKRNGPGVMITPDGERLEGVWVDDKLLSGDGGPI